MGKSQRDKGKRGERATANEIKLRMPDLAADVRRGWQSRQGDDDPDVLGLPGWWVEVKHGKSYKSVLMERLLAQAVGDSGSGADGTPVVVVRPDRKEPYALLRWNDLLNLIAEGRKAQLELDALRATAPQPGTPGQLSLLEGGKSK